MSAPILRLTTSQRPVFLVNSRLGHFSAASSGSRCAPVTIMRHPLSRSYGVILPSSLTRVIPRALGFSPHPPVLVYGTGTFVLARGFSWQCGISHFATYCFARIRISSLVRRICLSDQTTCLGTLFQPRAWPTLLRHPIAQTDYGGTGISTSCPSPTAFALGLGPDLP